MWPYLFSSRCGRILLGSYHMPDSVIGTACVLWSDSAVEHVGGLGRYSDRKLCVRIGAFNLIYTTCIRYISCICIYLGNFVFVLRCFFVYLFYCWIFSTIFIWCFFLSFFNGQRFLKDGRESENKDNNKTVIFHQHKREETVMIEHNKLAFDQRDYRLVKRSTWR